MGKLKWLWISLISTGLVFGLLLAWMGREIDKQRNTYFKVTLFGSDGRPIKTYVARSSEGFPFPCLVGGQMNLVDREGYKYSISGTIMVEPNE